MKNLGHQEPDEASPGLIRKQHCREDTWEEVVMAQLKSDWLTELDAMFPTIPQLVIKNNERDKKKNHISDKSTLDNLSKNLQKDANYCRTQYVKNFLQMGEIVDLIKKSTPIYVTIKIIPTFLVCASIEPTLLL
jgi:hypothetical protein